MFCLGFFPPVPISSRLFPTFSSIRFIISGFMWGSLIHLDLSFVQGDKNGSMWIFLHAHLQLNQHHLLKMLSFLHWIVSAPLSKIKWPYVCGFISGSSIVFHWSTCLSLYQYLQFLSQLLCSTAWGQGCWFPQKFFYCWEQFLLSWVFGYSNWIWELLFLTLWKNELEFWWGLHWIWTLLSVRWPLLLY